MRALAALLLALTGARGQAQLAPRTLVHAGVTRTWYEHVPAAYDGTRPVPLVLALHGFSGTGDQFAPASEWLPKSDAAGFIVVFPNGGLTAGTSFGWNAFVYNGNAPDDAGFLLALIRRLQQDYRIDASRIYMTGFSNGGGMTSTFAELHAGLLAGIAPISGGWRAGWGLPNPVVTPDAPLPVWIWRGSAEEVNTGSLTPAATDLNQVHYWAGIDRDGDAAQVFDQPPLTTSCYRGGRAEVRYTVIQGAPHAYQSGISARLWDDFFSLFSRQGKAIVYQPAKRQ